VNRTNPRKGTLENRYFQRSGGFNPLVTQACRWRKRCPQPNSGSACTILTASYGFYQPIYQL